MDAPMNSRGQSWMSFLRYHSLYTVKWETIVCHNVCIVLLDRICYWSGQGLVGWVNLLAGSRDLLDSTFSVPGLQMHSTISGFRFLNIASGD